MRGRGREEKTELAGSDASSAMRRSFPDRQFLRYNGERYPRYPPQRLRRLQNVALTVFCAWLALSSASTFSSPGQQQPSRQEDAMLRNNPIKSVVGGVLRPVNFLWSPFRKIIRASRRIRVRTRKRNQRRKACEMKSIVEEQLRTKPVEGIRNASKAEPASETVAQSQTFEAIVGQESFEQEGEDLRMKVTLSTLRRVRSKDVSFSIDTSRRLILRVFGQLVTNGTLYQNIKKDETYWELETNEKTGMPSVVISMVKANENMYWPTIFVENKEHIKSSWDKINKISYEIMVEAATRSDSGFTPMSIGEFQSMPWEDRVKRMSAEKMKKLQEYMDVKIVEANGNMTREEQQKMVEYYKNRNPEGSQSYLDALEKGRKHIGSDDMTIDHPALPTGSKLTFRRPSHMSKEKFEAAKKSFFSATPEQQQMILKSVAAHNKAKDELTGASNIEEKKGIFELE
eukprot:jgi/Bigna1/75001/fgenesh1_pg.32_\